MLVEVVSTPIEVDATSIPIVIRVGSSAANTVAWGNITGTLSNQTDLWAALQSKAVYIQTPPANQNDFSGLPGGVAPVSGIYFSAESNLLWCIWGGQSQWWHADLNLF